MKRVFRTLCSMLTLLAIVISITSPFCIKAEESVDESTETLETLPETISEDMAAGSGFGVWDEILSDDVDDSDTEQIKESETQPTEEETTEETEAPSTTEAPPTTAATTAPTTATKPKSTKSTEPFADRLTKQFDQMTTKEVSDPDRFENFPQYFQDDYPNKRFGSGTIASSGCGITSLAMVATYMTGHPYMPDELAKYFGGYGENNVQRLEYGAQMLRLPIRQADDIYDVMKALKKGDIAILLMNHMSIFTESQHFIVLMGLNDEGKIMVRDSYRPNYDKWNLKNAFVNGFELKDILLGYNGGWIFSFQDMPENPYIYKEEKPYVEPRYPGVELTWEEQQLLAKLIWLEARGESAKGQQAVAEVVLNRLVSGKYGDTLSQVIYGEGQFRTTKFLKDADAWQAQYDALDRALEGPYVLPIDVVHFATYPENNNIWGVIGGHVFCYEG